jgi:hypothetical protein
VHGIAQQRHTARKQAAYGLHDHETSGYEKCGRDGFAVLPAVGVPVAVVMGMVMAVVFFAAMVMAMIVVVRAGVSVSHRPII